MRSTITFSSATVKTGDHPRLFEGPFNLRPKVVLGTLHTFSTSLLDMLSWIAVIAACIFPSEKSMYLLEPSLLLRKCGILIFYKPKYQVSEAVVRRCSIKKVFFKISQILQENTCAKKDSGTGVFLWIFQYFHTYFCRTPLMAASKVSHQIIYM